MNEKGEYIFSGKIRYFIPSLSSANLKNGYFSLKLDDRNDWTLDVCQFLNNQDKKILYKNKVKNIASLPCFKSSEDLYNLKFTDGVQISLKSSDSMKMHEKLNDILRADTSCQKLSKRYYERVELPIDNTSRTISKERSKSAGSSSSRNNNLKRTGDEVLDHIHVEISNDDVIVKNESSALNGAFADGTFRSPAISPASSSSVTISVQAKDTPVLMYTRSRRSPKKENSVSSQNLGLLPSQPTRTPKKTLPLADNDENGIHTPIAGVSSGSIANGQRTPLAPVSGLSASAFYGTDNNDVDDPVNNSWGPTAASFSADGRNVTQRKRSTISIKRPTLETDRSNDNRSNSNSANKRKRLNNENEALWKSSSLSSPLSSKTPLLGFANLGNTCYMNSILQALFGLDVFAKELTKAFMHFENRIDEGSLLASLPLLLKNKNSRDSLIKKELLQKVKQAISSTATRFSGNSEQDAHEFLEQILDQLREEVKKLSDQEAGPSCATTSATLNPVENNVEFSVSHCIECLHCHNVINKEETFNVLPVVLPFTNDDENRSISLQKLIDDYFSNEQVQYKCELCSTDSSNVYHQFTKLPRVLIMHVKRYAFDPVTSKNLKCSKTIIIPKYLTLHKHCNDKSKPYSEVTESTKKIIVGGNDPSMTTPVVTPAARDFRAFSSNGNGYHGNNGFDSPEKFPSMESLMAPQSTKQSLFSGSTGGRAKRRLLGDKDDDFVLSTSTKRNGDLTTPTRGYNFRSNLKRPDYSDAISLTDVDGDNEKDSTMADIPELEDEEKQIQKALEISLHDSGPPATFDGADDEDDTFLKQMEEAKRLSLLESAEGSFMEMESDSLNNVDDNVIDLNPVNEENIPVEMDTTNANTSYVVDPELEEHAIKGHLPNAFRLCGIVTHLGSSSSTGHYVCDAYDSTKKIWRSYDDSHVSDTTEDDVINERRKTGYIFFYVAKKIVEDETFSLNVT